MTRDMRRFLAARFLVMLGWVVLFVAGLAVGIFIGDRISNAHLRWAVGWGILLASVRLGLRIQSRVLARIDPDGRLRGEFAKLGLVGRTSSRPSDRCPSGGIRRGANAACRPGWWIDWPRRSGRLWRFSFPGAPQNVADHEGDKAANDGNQPAGVPPEPTSTSAS